MIRNRATDLDARMHDGTTPLILAARLAVEGMAEELINSHADPNATDDSGEFCFIRQSLQMSYCLGNIITNIFYPFF